MYRVKQLNALPFCYAALKLLQFCTYSGWGCIICRVLAKSILTKICQVVEIRRHRKHLVADQGKRAVVDGVYS